VRTRADATASGAVLLIGLEKGFAMSLFGIRERKEIEKLAQDKRELHQKIIHLEQKVLSLKPKPRRWEIPDAAMERMLIAVDRYSKDATRINHYKLWKIIHGLIPETKNVECKIIGSNPGAYFVEEVLD
jgi:hypothetical protein